MSVEIIVSCNLILIVGFVSFSLYQLSKISSKERQSGFESIHNSEVDESEPAIEWGFTLNVKIPFYRHCWFWFVTFYPVFIALQVAYHMPGTWYLEASPQAFEEFFKQYKGIMWILSLTLGTSLVFGRLHNSKTNSVRLIQFQKSLSNSTSALKESQKKNHFDIRFKHEEEFSKFFDNTSVSSKDPSLKLRIKGEFQITGKSSKSSYPTYFPQNRVEMVQNSVSIEVTHDLLVQCREEWVKRLIEYEESEGSVGDVESPIPVFQNVLHAEFKLDDEPFDLFEVNESDSVDSEFWIGLLRLCGVFCVNTGVFLNEINKSGKLKYLDRLLAEDNPYVNFNEGSFELCSSSRLDRLMENKNKWSD